MMRRRLLPLIPFLLMAIPAMASEGAAEGSPVLGFSLRLLNMLLFFGLLVFLAARPIRGFFEKHTEELRDKLNLSRKQEDEAARLVIESEALTRSIADEVEKLRRKFEEERARLLAEARALSEATLLRLRQEHARALAQLQVEAGRMLASHVLQAARRESLSYLKSNLTPADRLRFLGSMAQRP